MLQSLLYLLHLGELQGTYVLFLKIIVILANPAFANDARSNFANNRQSVCLFSKIGCKIQTYGTCVGCCDPKA